MPSPLTGSVSSRAPEASAAERCKQADQAQVALGAAARPRDAIGHLGQELSVAHQFNRAERETTARALRRGSPSRRRSRFATTSSSSPKAAAQQVGELSRLKGIGGRLAVLGDIAADALSAWAAASTIVGRAGRRREGARQLTNGEFDAIEDLGKRGKLGELGEAAQLLHAAKHCVERVPGIGGGAHGPGRAIEGRSR
jgi:hypothetical protein